jgi:integrase
MARARKDKQGRALRKGETQRKQDGRYVYSYTTPYGKRRILYGKTLEELREKEKTVTMDLIEGINTYVAGKSTLNFVFDRYISSKTELRSSTMTNYLYMYNHYVRDTFGKLPIGSIKYSDVLHYYQGLLDRGIKVNTLESIHTVIHPTLQLAVRDNIIRINPSNEVMAEIKKKNVKKHPSLRHALTLEEQVAFIKYVTTNPVHHRWGPLFTVMLGTGCRVGEIIGLRWKDLDMKNRMISINHSVTYYPRSEKSYKCEFEVSLPKTEAGIRTIPMLDEVYEAFLEERKYQEKEGFCEVELDGMTGFIFRNRFGELHNPAAINRAIKRIVENYNAEEIVNAEKQKRKAIIVPKFSCHILRHTFCTRFCENETNIKVIQSVMGHADIQTTYDINAEVTDLKKKESFENLAKNLKIF